MILTVVIVHVCIVFVDKHCVSCNLIPLSCVGIRVSSLQSSAVIVPVLFIFSRFVPLGNWWHESTVTDCRSCCDLSTMWPILIKPIVLVINLELEYLRVYFYKNGLKKKKKALTKIQYTSIWLTYTHTDSQNCHGLKMPETGLCISCKLWVRGNGAKVALNCYDTTLPTMQFHFQRCKARGSLKVSLGREIISALHDCAKYR